MLLFAFGKVALIKLTTFNTCKLIDCWLFVFLAKGFGIDMSRVDLTIHFTLGITSALSLFGQLLAHTL